MYELRKTCRARDLRLWSQVSDSELRSKSETYTSDDEVAKGHLGAVEVEEVHEFGRLALTKGVVVDPFRLVVELDLDGEDLDTLCERNG